MAQSPTRRRFLVQATQGAAAWGGAWTFLGRLPHVSAEEAALPAHVARVASDVAPIVKLIEETPRERLLESVASRIRAGTSYREILAGLLLAGVRNVQPQPQVGFKFHCVLVINACHLASLSGPDSDRWLPIFWALDYFKSSQAEEAQTSGWRLPPVDDSRVPDPQQARQAFISAMNSWDVDAADAATAGLVRGGGATDVFNLFAQFAARDFRAIGHKAIFLANSWRTLQVIGWEFAEPVLRSLTAALLNHNGEPNPARSDLSPDRSWKQNQALSDRIPAAWLSGATDAAAPGELVTAMRSDPLDAARAATELLEHGLGSQVIWDAVFVGGGELLMQQPGIVSLHGLTTANALHYLWRTVADDNLRKQLLLQACSFGGLFREAAKNRGPLSDATIDSLISTEKPASPGSVDEILAEMSGDRGGAAARVEAYLASGGDPRTFIDAARRLIFLKGRDAHDYKFSSAVLEDYDHLSPAWRDRFLALSVFNLKGSGERDNDLVARTRAALDA